MGTSHNKNKKEQIPQEENFVVVNNEIINKDINLILKIYVINNGNAQLNQFLMDNLFKDSINDPYLKTKGEKEIKTEQFHWIISTFEDKTPIKTICDTIQREIDEDRNEVRNEDNQRLLKHRVIICIEECDLLADYFIKMSKPRIIFITKTKYNIAKIDKRYITNIIYSKINEKEISSLLISSLWELDCFFNGRGNKICRYSPENLLKYLENYKSLNCVNILLLGKPGVGKSSFVNLISGKMIALESDDNFSSTKRISEYYIYNEDDEEYDKKDGKKKIREEKAAIKFIDTPGIDDDSEEYKHEREKIINLIQNNNKEINPQKKIHFIFFFFIFEDLNLEIVNLDDIFKKLKECKCPIFFIINKSPNDENDEDEYYYALEDSLSKTNSEDILSKDKYIKINLKEGEIEGFFGINTIFKKIKDYFDENKILNKNLKFEMNNLIKEFRKIENDDSFLSLKYEDDKEFKQLLNDNQFKQKMGKIKKMAENNIFFSKIESQSIIDNGRAVIKECHNIIPTFSKLYGIFPKISEDVPIKSIIHAYMVKEITNGYGLNNNSLNYCLKLLKRNLVEIIKNEKKQIDKNDNENNNKELTYDIITKAIQDILDKSNKKLIFQISYVLNELFEIVKYKNIGNIVENFNEKFIIQIEDYCQMFYEKEIKESEGLTFMVNYFNKLNSILNDIDYYINKENWNNYEIQIHC